MCGSEYETFTNCDIIIHQTAIDVSEDVITSQTIPEAILLYSPCDREILMTCVHLTYPSYFKSLFLFFSLQFLLKKFFFSLIK
jgi:hypothetical protein